jgi:hypothetical protein
MTKAKENSKINPELEKHLSKLMKEVMNSAETSLTDKMKVVDRVLKFELMKLKITDNGFGSGFKDEPDDD